MKNTIQQQLGQTDIYLIDQIMKGRYQQDDLILDAGCGSGRNLHWFLHNNYNITGTDISKNAIAELKNKYPHLSVEKFAVMPVEATVFFDNQFNHIICSAVLHFAESTSHFKKMMAEMVRILKPGGSLFIRMTSDIGIEDKVKHLGDGVYLIPDGTKRFLLTRALLKECLAENNLQFTEQFKTVNIDDIRCMSTLMLQKNKKM